ncbi:MAG: tetratricopeptide repeat protein [Magnetococcales bacterium]|nr:tetratricopeptide repeat protein [Magnetococcales bacterium]
MTPIEEQPPEREQLTLGEAYNQAVEQFNAGRLNEVERIGSIILQAVPTHLETINLLGVTAQTLQQHDQAVAQFRHGLELNDQVATLHFNLGISLQALGATQAAMSALQSAVALEPDNPQYKETLRRLQEAPSSVPIPDQADSAAIQRGLDLHHAGQLDEASACFQEILRQHPDHAPALNNLGNVLSQANQLEEAVAHYQKAIAIQPDSPHTHFNLGNALSGMNRLEEAVASYQRAITLDGQLAEYHYNLGIVEEKRHNTLEALTCYQTALRIKPDFAEARKAYETFLKQQVPNWHFAMMNDLPRNDAYEAAIKAAVTPDSTVLDIGTGGGLLAMMAAKHGAKKVYTVEVVPIIAQLAREIIQKNGYEEVITVLNKESTLLKIGQDLPQRADILVTETFDVGLIGERAISFIQHAHEHLLKENATIIPQRAVVYGALLESDSLYKMGKVETVSGFDLSPFNICTTPYMQLPLKDYAHHFLSDRFEIFDFDFANGEIQEEHKMLSITPTQSGTCHAVAFWFRLFLDQNQHYDTSTQHNPDNHWQQAIHIVDDPRSVQPGEPVSLITSHDRKTIHLALDQS